MYVLLPVGIVGWIIARVIGGACCRCGSELVSPIKRTVGGSGQSPCKRRRTPNAIVRSPKDHDTFWPEA